MYLYVKYTNYIFGIIWIYKGNGHWNDSVTNYQSHYNWTYTIAVQNGHVNDKNMDQLMCIAHSHGVE